MDYSDSQFGKMQEEAMRRVREMQQRSRSAVGQDSPPPAPPPPPPPPDKPEQNSSGNILGSILGDINIDEEKALIALLIFILYKQGADIKLLLGLAYLLL